MVFRDNLLQIYCVSCLVSTTKFKCIYFAVFTTNKTNNLEKEPFQANNKQQIILPTTADHRKPILYPDPLLHWVCTVYSKQKILLHPIALCSAPLQIGGGMSHQYIQISTYISICNSPFRGLSKSGAVQLSAQCAQCFNLLTPNPTV
jgi:hypothetical protein